MTKKTEAVIKGMTEEFCYDPEQGDRLTRLGMPQVTTGKKKSKVKVKDTHYEVNASTFNLRSPSYLKDKVKEPSEDAAFELVKSTFITFQYSVWHAAENLRSVKDYLAQFPNDFFFIIVRQVPGKPRTTVVSITRKKPVEKSSPSEDLLQKYLDGDDEFKNKRLKYIARLENAPWAILATVKGLGGEKPVIMGNGYLKQHHYSGANYYEVDVDISASFVARQIAGSVAKFSHLFKVSECFVIEGQSEEELPERAIAAWCYENISVKRIAFNLTEEDLAFFKSNPKPPMKSQTTSPPGRV